MSHYKYSMDFYIQKMPELLEGIINNREAHNKSVIDAIKESDCSEIILLGSGSSYTAALSSKYIMQKLMRKTITIIYPNNALHYERFYNSKAVVIGISQSGNSVAAIEAVKHMKELGYPTIALTADPESDIAKAADHLIDLGIGEESCGPKTVGYQATVLNLILLALNYSFQREYITKDEFCDTLQAGHNTILNLPRIRQGTIDWYEKNKERMIAIQKISVVGYGSNYGTALEASLKLIETVRCPSYGYEFEEYLHGPNDGIDHNSTIFLLQTPDVEAERMERFHSFAEKITTEGFLITSKKTEKNNIISLPFLNNEIFTVLEYVLPVQYLAYRISMDKGINLTEIKYPEYYSIMNCKTKI